MSATLTPDPSPSGRGEKAQADERAHSRAPLRSYSLRVLCVSVVILLLAAGLRFYRLGAQSLWNDEGSSYVQATRTLPEIAAHAARDIHPPGYYALLAGWRLLVGESEFALRSLSAFASVVTVALSYAIGRRLFNPATGLVAALLLALNTFSIYYAQEARMYALLALWGAAGMWMLGEGLRAQDSGLSRKRVLAWMLLLAGVNAAGLYTQYAYPFVMLAQGAAFGVWLVVRVMTPVGTPEAGSPPATVADKPAERGLTGEQAGGSRRFLIGRVVGLYVAANVLTIVLYLPWLPTAWGQVTTWPNTGDPIPAGEALETIIGWFVLGITYTGIPPETGTILLVVGGLTLGLGAWLLARGWGVIWWVAVPLAWVMMPVVMFLLLGLFRPANLKFLLPAQVGVDLWLGAGLAGWWQLTANPSRTIRRVGWIGSAAAGVLALWVLLHSAILGLTPLYYSDRYQRADYRAMAALISAEPRPGHAIILDAPNQEEVFRYYYRGDAPVYPLPPGLGGNDEETRRLVREVIAGHERIFVLFWGEAERDPNYIVERTLDSEAFEAGQDTWYGDVRLAQYVTSGDLPGGTASGAIFGGQITLVQYSLSGTRLPAGEVLQVELLWQSNTRLDQYYKVFAQLLNADGVLVAQHDSEPQGGSMPTIAWRPGETITDRHGIVLPGDLLPGDYRLIVGIYRRDAPHTRLPVGGGDFLELGIITVE